MKHVRDFLLGVLCTIIWYQISAFVHRVDAMEQWIIHVSETQ